MTEPDGGVFTYTFDAASRLTSLVNPRSERTTYAHDPLGRAATMSYANGTRTTYAYDLAGRTTAVRNSLSNGTAISEFAYTLDSAGNPTNVVLANGDGLSGIIVGCADGRVPILK